MEVRAKTSHFMITSYCSSYFSYSLKCVKATMITKSSTLPFMKLHWSRIRLLHSQAFTECLLCTRRHAGQWGDVWTERVELQFFSVFSHTYINAFLTTKYNYYRNYCACYCVEVAHTEFLEPSCQFWFLMIPKWDKKIAKYITGLD